MRSLLLILNFILILTGTIDAKAEDLTCGVYNGMQYTCGAGEKCCPNSQGAWECCPQGYSCCFPGSCCAPGEVCCNGTCCNISCGKDGKCPPGAKAISGTPAVQGMTSAPK